MGININHPSFISFLDNVTKTILAEIDIKTYFNLTPEKRIKLQKAVFSIIKKTAKGRAFINDVELKAFIIVLQKKNEQLENYEISAVFKDIIMNFDVINPPADKKINETSKITQ